MDVLYVSKKVVRVILRTWFGYVKENDCNQNKEGTEHNLEKEDIGRVPKGAREEADG